MGKKAIAVLALIALLGCVTPEADLLPPLSVTTLHEAPDRYPLREDGLNRLRTKAEAEAASMAADLSRAMNVKPF